MKNKIKEEVLKEFLEGFKDIKSTGGKPIDADTLMDFGAIGLLTLKQLILP